MDSREPRGVFTGWTSSFYLRNVSPRTTLDVVLCGRDEGRAVGALGSPTEEG